MRLIILLSVFIIISACNNDEQTEKITIPETTSPTPDHPSDINYRRPDSISGKPASFYLGHSEVSGIAKDFFLGKFKAGDNDSTAELISYITTDNSAIRPFYRWCIDRIMTISDGALSELIGDPALDYAVKFPEEFISYMNSKKPKGRWVELMAYSSFKFGENAALIKKEIVTKMNENCRNCNSSIKKDIERFGNDIMEKAKTME